MEPSALLTLDPGSAPRKAARLVQDDEYVWLAQPVDYARAALTEYVRHARANRLRARATHIRVIPVRVARSAIA